MNKYLCIYLKLESTSRYLNALQHISHCPYFSMLPFPKLFHLTTSLFHTQRTENNKLGKSKVNLSNPTRYVMHQQFNIQQLYVLPTPYLCVLYLSENKQRLVLLTA